MSCAACNGLCAKFPHLLRARLTIPPHGIRTVRVVPRPAESLNWRAGASFQLDARYFNGVRAPQADAVRPFTRLSTGPLAGLLRLVHSGDMLRSPIPLIFAADEVSAGRSRNALARACQRPRSPVLRLRRGVYVHHSQWDALGSEQRHMAKVVAVMAGANHPTSSVLTRESAAVVHGIPMVGPLPGAVQLCSATIDRPRSSSTTRLTVAPRGNEVVRIDGAALTSMAQTLVDLACARPFRSALASLDWALHEGRVTVGELEEVMGRQSRRHGMTRARFALSYADGRSESVGESLSRAVMIEHHLPLPDLQYKVMSEDVCVARTDFMWPASVCETGRPVIGEFHGRVKFGQEIAGDDPRGRAALELQRSELVRLWTGGEVVAWEWDDAFRETEMLRRLARAGVVPGLRLPAPVRRVGLPASH